MGVSVPFHSSSWHPHSLRVPIACIVLLWYSRTVRPSYGQVPCPDTLLCAGAQGGLIIDLQEATSGDISTWNCVNMWSSCSFFTLKTPKFVSWRCWIYRVPQNILRAKFSMAAKLLVDVANKHAESGSSAFHRAVSVWGYKVYRYYSPHFLLHYSLLSLMT